MYKNDVGFWRYLKGKQWYCLGAVLLIAEMLMYACLNAEPSDAYQKYVAETMPVYPGVFSFIFIENTKAVLITILFGVVPFGIGTLCNVYFTIDRLVSTAKALLLTINGKNLFFCTIPHGVMEGAALLFAVILSCLLSRAVTTVFVRAVKKKPILPELKTDLRFIGRAILFVLIPVLFLAAMIETWISPIVIQCILS